MTCPLCLMSMHSGRTVHVCEYSLGWDNNITNDIIINVIHVGVDYVPNVGLMHSLRLYTHGSSVVQAFTPTPGDLGSLWRNNGNNTLLDKYLTVCYGYRLQ